MDMEYIYRVYMNMDTTKGTGEHLDVDVDINMDVQEQRVWVGYKHGYEHGCVDVGMHVGLPWFCLPNGGVRFGHVAHYDCSKAPFPQALSLIHI